MGLELCAVVRALTPIGETTLRCRVGIATGPVIIGDPTGAAAPGKGERGGEEIVGGVPDVAARLRALAPPDTVAVGGVTRRLVGNLFEFRDLGSVDTGDGAQPMPSYGVLGESLVSGRFEAFHHATLSPLVGREEEFELLVRRWARAKAEGGRIVLVSGEAGIGKSRLAAAFEERLDDEPHLWLRYFCSPHHQDSALFPVIDELGRAAGFTRDDPPSTRLEKLENSLALTAAPSEDIALIADLLSLPASLDHPTPNLSPQMKKQRTLEALIRQIEIFARRQPILMVVEDAHWIDPTSRELLDLVVERLNAVPVLLIVTFRPEFQPPWIGQPGVTVLALNRLNQRERTALVAHIARGKALPNDIVAQIADRTDGVPLFIEELTRSVLESGSLREETDRYVLDKALPQLAIPTSLNASLMARLDRVGPAKATAQIGAAIGREFSHEFLAAVMRRPEAELAAALDRLIAAGLLFRQGVPPHATYMFKHALVQDAAYGTLLREPRRALHARIAETLESQFSDIAQSRPELLARHCTEAGLIEKASGLWGRAGQRSLGRSALAEAAEQFMRALGQIETLPATPALRREQSKLQVALLTPLIHINGFAAPETKAAAERARLLIEQAEALGEPPEDPLLLFSVLYGFWAANCLAFNGDAACGLAAQFLSLAEKQGAATPLMVGHRLMGVSLMCTGHIAESRVHYDQAIALYDPVEHRPLATRFGNDTEVVVLGFRSWALWLLGHPAAALRDANDALEKARDLGQAATLMFALWLVTIPHILCGNCSFATALFEEVSALSEEKGASPWKAIAMAFHGCALALTGNASDAVHMITTGITAWRSTGSTVALPVYLSHLARAYVELGKFDDAWRCIDEATTLMKETKETWFEAEVYRVAGEIALQSPVSDAVKGEAYFARALAVAHQQRAKSLELRGTISMARLWHDQGKRQQARDLLADTYGWFTEGFETSDLKEAKALLDALA
jgi:predicted ATPase